MANGNVKSARDIIIERNVKLARARKLNPEAVLFATKYVNMNLSTLTLVSNFYDALDLPPGEEREHNIRAAIDGVFRYIRTLPKENDSEAA